MKRKKSAVRKVIRTVKLFTSYFVQTEEKLCYAIAKKVFYFELFTAAASRFLVPECLMVLKSNNCMRYGIQRIVGAVWLGEISASSLVRKS